MGHLDTWCDACRWLLPRAIGRKQVIEVRRMNLAIRCCRPHAFGSIGSALPTVNDSHVAQSRLVVVLNLRTGICGRQYPTLAATRTTAGNCQLPHLRNSINEAQPFAPTTVQPMICLPGAESGSPSSSWANMLRGQTKIRPSLAIGIIQPWMRS